ncbi:MAG: hypothetical protein ACK4N1_12895 [Pseudorhizobium sp.]
MPVAGVAHFISSIDDTLGRAVAMTDSDRRSGGAPFAQRASPTTGTTGRILASCITSGTVSATVTACIAATIAPAVTATIAAAVAATVAAAVAAAVTAAAVTATIAAAVAITLRGGRSGPHIETIMAYKHTHGR